MFFQQKARCHSNNRLAAIKIIKLKQQEGLDLIEREILMMRDCVHPNIVAFYGSYIRRDKLWICMEYCGGGSLQDMYYATGPLPERSISYVSREVLRGLHYLHSTGKMHRDVKGANILLSEAGDVKLADFGISAQITSTMNCKRNTFIGTPYWMAPEVAAVERKGGYNQSCDIWSVGITAIELAELQPPMYDIHPMRALFIMTKSSFKPPTLKAKDNWSASFHDFVKMALTKNPKKRPSAERLLMHSFVRIPMDRRLVLNLLDKARNPNQYNLVLNELDPEDELAVDLPQRIASKKSVRSKPLNSRPELDVQRFDQNVAGNPQVCKIIEPKEPHTAQLISTNVDVVGSQANCNQSNASVSAIDMWIDDSCEPVLRQR